MRIHVVLALSLFLALPNFLYQQSAAKKNADRKQRVVARPASFDSTKTFEEQYKPESKYQFIGLQLFLPPVINPEAGPVVFSKKGSGFTKGNRSYTITGILNGEMKELMGQKNITDLCGYRYKDPASPVWKEMIVHVIFILRDNNRADSSNNAPLYWVVSESKVIPYSSSYFNSFVALPYFEKQKQLYQNQNVIKLDDKSKWLCKEVFLQRAKDLPGQDSAYKVFCLLQNEKGVQIKLAPPSEKYGRIFISEKEYNWLDHADRNHKEKLLKEENEKREKRKADCIARFGKKYGELVAQNKAEAGMTSEMCKEAWGEPWDISENGTDEIWYYNWKYSLHFKNKVLVKIKP